MSTINNIAAFLPKMANERPHDLAIIMPQGRDFAGRVAYTHFTFAQLNRDSDQLAAGLLAIGLERGDRCALMVKPSLDFFSLMFALFKAGIVPVLIDPGIGIKPLQTCLAEAAPRGFIGITAAHIARKLFGWGKDSITINVSTGFFGGVPIKKVRALGASKTSAAIVDSAADELAAILFTSGSTGIPKGVEYRHGTFIAQVEMIRDTYDIQPGEIDLPTFPPFALFDPALGMTAVIPDMDARKPAKVKPQRIYEAIENFGITNMFGSPALLNTISRHAQSTGKKLPTLRRVLSAGAPASPITLERMQSILAPGVQVFTPYGATESLPVCSIGSDEILATRSETDSGKGICVGKPVERMKARIIAISDDAIERFEESLCLAPGSIGEIVVQGPPVTERYFHRDAATALAKIHDEDGNVLHRMGDLGYFDDAGRLWFCGRKAHRVRTAERELYTIPVEGIFNTHQRVFRTALVGIGTPGQQRPVVCVELETKQAKRCWRRIQEELREIGSHFEITKALDTFLLHPGFPVDIRHNAKIGREKLAPWAESQLR